MSTITDLRKALYNALDACAIIIEKDEGRFEEANANLHAAQDVYEATEHLEHVAVALGYTGQNGLRFVHAVSGEAPRDMPDPDIVTAARLAVEQFPDNIGQLDGAVLRLHAVTRGVS